MAVPYSRTIIGELPWYSVLIVSGIVLAIVLASREEKRLGLPKDTIVDLALIVVPFGIVGARLYYVLMSWEMFADDPLSALYIWRGGLAIYGAVIGGAVGAALYAYRKKLSFALLADVCAPGLLLAQAIGRWGNYFNMEAYGVEIADPRLQFFPLAVLIPSAAGDVWHAATFFYESVWNLAGFAALWLLRKGQKEKGNVFAWYLLIYGAGRFVIEQLRTDSLYLGPLRVSQYLSLALCTAAALLLVYRKSRRSSKPFAAMAVCCLLWLMRWFLLEVPLAYAASVFAAGVAALWLARDRRRALGWLLGAVVLDGLGLMAAVMQWPAAAGAAGLVHALVCSATLPAGVYGLCTQEE